MRNTFPLLAASVGALLVVAGCAGPETKMGRGINNTMEIVRMSEMERSIEQTTLFSGNDAGIATGAVKGFNKTLARTGLGLYEIITAPIPPYDPVWTSYLSPDPAFPDSYKPSLPNAQALNTDDQVWFSSGTTLPWLPGNRFRVFDN